MSTIQTVRRWRVTDLARIGWVHSRSRQDAYARLVPAAALARATPEQQTVMWTARFARLPEQHAAFVVEHDGAVLGFALTQFNPVSGAELNAIHVLPDQQGEVCPSRRIVTRQERMLSYRRVVHGKVSEVYA